MSISVKIMPMEDSDVPAAVDLLYQQKISLTINKVMWRTWPNEIVQRARITSAMEGSMNDSSAKCFKVVGNETKEFLGVLVLTRRQPPSPDKVTKIEQSDQGEAVPKGPDGLDLDVVDVVVKALDKISEDVAGIDHMEITALVIAPSMRKCGLGSQLMQVAFECAKADRVPILVCSEPESNSFFPKLGFREIKHHDIDLSAFATPFSGFGTFRFIKMKWSVQDQAS